LLLASIGRLEGRDATTHWAYHRYLPAFGARYVQQRWVRNNGIINSAGVSAGIDMALQLVAELTNEATARRVQLALHYDPDPPLGGIHYKQLPPLMRTVRALMTLTVPAYTRRPRQLLRRGA
jgi:transcriptional regulator GlxA family with amidase domain